MECVLGVRGEEDLTSHPAGGRDGKEEKEEEGVV